MATSALSTPQAVTVELTAMTRLMLAFKSLSQVIPQLSHLKVRSLRDKDSFLCPQLEQVFEDGNHLSTITKFEPRWYQQECVDAWFKEFDKLFQAPVIAVPTSVGYGTSFGGLSALLTMLNSCATGIGVVNIDNGFGAAMLAGQILRLANKFNSSR